jgi:hypothetical protein
MLCFSRAMYIRYVSYVRFYNLHEMMSLMLIRVESPSLVLVINDTKLLMSCVKCIELGISNTCDEGVCGKEWWPQNHKEMVMDMK